MALEAVVTPQKIAEEVCKFKEDHPHNGGGANMPPACEFFVLWGQLRD